MSNSNPVTDLSSDRTTLTVRFRHEAWDPIADPGGGWPAGPDLDVDAFCRAPADARLQVGADW